MSRWMSFQKDSGDFRPSKPFGQFPAFVEILFTDLGSGNSNAIYAVINSHGLDITLAGRMVNQFAEWNHAHSQFFAELSYQLLRFIRTIKRPVLRVAAR